MKPDFFTYLPPQTITNILSRLPIQTIAISKCVCKPWLHLLESNEFINSHLAKSVPALFIKQSTPEWDSSSCSIFKFEDGHELEPHDLHYHQLTKFDFPHSVTVEGSANGLLFLRKVYDTHYVVCNPITRDYIELRFPEELIPPYRKVVNFPDILEDNVYAYPPSFTCGFGASKMRGEYKVVLISHDSVIDVHNGETPRRIIPELDCHVYTMGMGSWRRVEPPGDRFGYDGRTSSVFLDGSLHWIVSDSDDKLWISCFDLETERFGTFPTPPLFQETWVVKPGMTVLGDCLCLCDHTREQETVIWLMKEYGVEESWSKEYVININQSLDIEGFELVFPFKVFEDGDILMYREGRQLFYYSSKTETAQEIGIFTAGAGNGNSISAIVLTTSFLSLKSFGMENFVSF